MDNVDHQLIGQLRRDGRAPIAALAAALGISRATVRSRLERLRLSGEITGFTVLTRTDAAEAPVRGLIMIEIEGRGGDRVAGRLAAMPAVTAVHSTHGRWDIIAEVATDSLLALDELIRRIRSLEGVVTSETSLLLSSRRARAG